MKLHVIGTGSKGNCYVIEDNDEFVILEAGIAFDNIIKYFTSKNQVFDISKTKCLLITHEHGDHSQYIEKYHEAGIQLISSDGTKEALGTNSISVIEKWLQISDNLSIFTLPSFHDAVEPVNFVIDWNGNRIVYVTDTGKFNYKMKFDIDCLICEINYDEKTIENNMSKGKFDPNLYKRVVDNHLSLEQVLNLLRHNNRTIKQLVVCHISSSNLNQNKVVDTIIPLTGIPTTIAKKNVEIIIN